MVGVAAACHVPPVGMADAGVTTPSEPFKYDPSAVSDSESADGSSPRVAEASDG